MSCPKCGYCSACGRGGEHHHVPKSWTYFGDQGAFFEQQKAAQRADEEMMKKMQHFLSGEQQKKKSTATE